MHEAALMAVDLGKGGAVLAPSDGHQQSRGSAAVFMHEHRVLSTVGEFQLSGSGGRGGGFHFVTGGMHCLAPPLSTTGRREDVALLSFQWSPWDPGGYTRAGPARRGCPPYLQESKIKSRNLFKIS